MKPVKVKVFHPLKMELPQGGNLGLYFWVEEDNLFWFIRGKAVEIINGSIQTILFGPASGLIVEAHTGFDRDVYFCRVGYQCPDFVNYETSKEMTSLLGKIESRLLAMRGSPFIDGYWQNFPTYVDWICQILNIDTLVFRIQGNSACWADNQHLFFNRADGVGYLSKITQAHQEARELPPIQIKKEPIIAG